MKPTLVLVATVLVNAFVAAQGLSWPGFRGPAGAGLAVEATPPASWSDDENVAWKIELPGPGASSPIVLGERVYVTCYSGYGHYLDDGGDFSKLKHHLVCVDRTTGKIIWNTVVPGPLLKEASQMQKTEHGFATPTPVTDGKAIYAYFGRAGVYGFDLKGDVIWKRSLGQPDPAAAAKTNAVVRDGKALTLRWGAAASPVIAGELVIVNCSEESNSIRALHRKKGELVWKHEHANLEGCATTPVVVGPKGKETLVIVLAGEVWGMDPQTGEMRFEVPTGTRGGMSPSPVSDGKHVFCFGGMGKSFAIRLGPLGKTRPTSKPTRVAWQGDNQDIPSPLLHDGKLILVQQMGKATVLDATTGKTLSSGRLDGRTGKIYASPILAAGRMYVVSRKRGTFVYSIDGKFKLLARNEVTDDSHFNASPAVVGSQLFLRSDKHLYCVQAKKGEKPKKTD